MGSSRSSHDRAGVADLAAYWPTWLGERQH
jgi:hypothetical protein